MDDAREAIATIAEWVSQDRSVSHVGGLLALQPNQHPLPPPLQELWDETAARDLLLPPTSIGEQVADFLQGLDDRERLILELRIWPPTGRSPLRRSGEKLGMTRERVRQIESSVVTSAVERLRRTEFMYIRARSGELRHRLGSVAPQRGALASRALSWCVRDVPGAQRQAALDLLLWLAGPYVVANGWWRLASGAPDERGADLRLLASSGFISDESLDSALAAMDVHPDVRFEWMDGVGRFHKVNGGWLDASGSIIDQALRYLAFRGVPMTTEEILEGIGRADAVARGIRSRLFDDPRAVRVSKSEIGLPEWGHNEYTSLAEEMLEELDRVGGRMPLDQLVERLVDQFGVSATSVRMNAGRTMFLLDETGFIQLRPEDQPYEVRDDLLRVPGCYELSASVASWRLQVDRDVLRGSGRHIPEQLAGWLRLRPGQTMSLQNATRPIAVAWRPWAQPDTLDR